MKFIKKGTAISLCVALLFSFVATTLFVIGASKTWSGAQLGDLSQYYEIGDSADPGFISTVAGDSGGTSYGLYMFASHADTPYKFAQWCQYYSGNININYIGSQLVYAYLYPTAGYGSNFNAQWTALAKEYKSDFITAQKEYWKETQYNLLLAKIAAQYPSFNVNYYSIALQNVLWSRSVQHGVEGALTVFVNAMNSLPEGTFCYQNEADIIEAIYKECSKLDTTTASNSMASALAKKYGINGRSMAWYSVNSGDVQVSVYRRLRINEPNDALVMYTENMNSTNTLHDGYYTFVETANNQTRYIANDSGSAVVASSESLTPIRMRVSTFANGGNTVYTIENNGRRLADVNGTISFVEPTSSAASQLWYYSGGFLQNASTNNYLTISNGNFTSHSDQTEATSFTAISTSGITAYGLVYPGFDSSLTYALPYGSSGFPVRGTIESSKTLSNITVTVAGTSSNGFTVSKNISSEYSFDLWNLDNSCKFSSLAIGSYTITITATEVGGAPITLVDSVPFSVVEGEKAKETYTVSFVSNGVTISSATYDLGDVYGKLPDASKSGANFIGWFNEDGEEITTTSMVAAKDHTLTARFDDLHTYYFLNYDGSVFESGQLSAGQNIPQPTKNPVRINDGTNTYTFTGWVGYTTDATMGTSDISFSPSFSASPISSGGGSGSSGGSSGGGSSTTIASGTYLSGIVPNTSVSILTSGGYVVKNGNTVVTSGLVGTGMTATANGTTITIVVTGDTNGDGKLSITDVVKLQSYVAGSSTLSGAFKEAADINKDGSVSITDVVQAAQVTVGNRTLTK